MSTRQLFAFGFLLDTARKHLTPELCALFLSNTPGKDSRYPWFGLIGHLYAVYTLAKRLGENTSLDIRTLATLHDIGKLFQYEEAVRTLRETLEPVRLFEDHETRSAEYAKGLGLSDGECLIIRHHNLAFNSMHPTGIVWRLKKRQKLVRKWILLCAADAVGQGPLSDPERQERRAFVAGKFRDVAGLVEIPANDSVLKAALEALATWDPPEIPDFSGRLLTKQLPPATTPEG